MLSDFGCCCSQRKCKQLNFACGFSHIEETLKHYLNLCKGLCINDWAAVLKDLLQSPHVEKFLVTCWSWPTAISSLQLCWTRWLPAVLSDLLVIVSCEQGLSVCRPLTGLLLPTFHLADGSLWGGGEGAQFKPQQGQGPCSALIADPRALSIFGGSTSHLLEYCPSQESKHLLFPHFNIGLWEKGGDYCFIPRV